MFNLMNEHDFVGPVRHNSVGPLALIKEVLFVVEFELILSVLIEKEVLVVSALVVLRPLNNAWLEPRALKLGELAIIFNPIDLKGLTA